MGAYTISLLFTIFHISSKLDFVANFLRFPPIKNHENRIIFRKVTAYTEVTRLFVSTVQLLN